MGEPALKLPKIDRLKAAAEAEWNSLRNAEVVHAQARGKIQMHRHELGLILIRLRKEVERQLAKPASTGGRPKSIWWEWFAEWRPGTIRDPITRDEATRAMQIAGDDDPDGAEEHYKTRQRAAKAKSRSKTFLGDRGSVTQESPPIVSLQVRQIEGMIRKLSCEDREALFNRIKDLLS